MKIPTLDPFIIAMLLAVAVMALVMGVFIVGMERSEEGSRADTRAARRGALSWAIVGIVCLVPSVGAIGWSVALHTRPTPMDNVAVMVLSFIGCFVGFGALGAAAWLAVTAKRARPVAPPPAEPLPERAEGAQTPDPFRIGGTSTTVAPLARCWGSSSHL